MRNLTINDLKLGLEELLDPNKPRYAELSATKAFGVYGDDLKHKLKLLRGVSPEVPGVSRITTFEITETDQAHDGFGGAIYYTTESYLRAPDTPRELRNTALELRDIFINNLAELRGSYADEASRAKARLPKLEEYKSKLEMFPIAGGKTLYDWAKSYINSGIKLDKLMSERSYVEAGQSDPARSAAGTLRAETISLLATMRLTIQYELTQNKSLPPNLDALLFGYFDELQLKRQAAIAPTSPAIPALAPTSKENDE